jgi:hypothetical protein
MTRRSDPLSIEFLQNGLSNGPVLASELEAAARAAGLLRSDQRISDAKPLKRAKQSLGIRSVRNGFGSAGEWFWVLEKQSTRSAVAEPASEAAPRIPSSWIEGIGHLSQCRPSPDLPAHRWGQFLTDCHKFLNSPAWAERAVALGWDALALFGCRRHRPLDPACWRRYGRGETTPRQCVRLGPQSPFRNIFDGRSHEIWTGPLIDRA